MSSREQLPFLEFPLALFAELSIQSLLLPDVICIISLRDKFRDVVQGILFPKEARTESAGGS